MRPHISVVLSHPGCGTSLQQSQRTNTVSKAEVSARSIAGKKTLDTKKLRRMPRESPELRHKRTACWGWKEDKYLSSQVPALKARPQKVSQRRTRTMTWAHSRCWHNHKTHSRWPPQPALCQAEAAFARDSSSECCCSHFTDVGAEALSH